MRGHFSIEWMAQSSQPAPPVPVPGPVAGPVLVPEACGTHSESLPGFYSRQDPGSSSEQQRGGRTHRQNLLDPAVEAAFSSGTEEETSGYESEGGRSLSPSAHIDADSAHIDADSAHTAADSAPASPPVGRRPRTAFTAEQVSVLERSFKRNAYLGTQDKAELCRKLNLSDKQIRNWFQNRRMKLKRTVQDALAHACQASVASQFLRCSEVQAYRPGPCAPFQPEAPPAHLHPHGLQYGSSLTGTSSLPLDSFYQYAGLPGIMLPSTAHLRGVLPDIPPVLLTPPPPQRSPGWIYQGGVQ